MTLMAPVIVSEKSEQFKIDGKHYVGKRVKRDDGKDIVQEFENETCETVQLVLFRLDYGNGDVFVDPTLLEPFPSEPIPEPTK